MPDELKCPNPECDSERPPRMQVWMRNEHWASCRCGTAGPYKPTPSEARAAWKRITFKTKED